MLVWANEGMQCSGDDCFTCFEIPKTLTETLD